MKHKKKKKGMNPSGMRCPYCGGTLVLRSADGIYHENKSGTMLYVCTHYPQCDTYVRTHPGTTIPVGTPANRELRALRNEAHRYIDQLQHSGLMAKQEAYIGYLGEYYCMQVIEESKKLLERQQKTSRICFRSCEGGAVAS